MSTSGDRTDLMLMTRRALLDALEALAEHRDAVVVIGAQAVYLHTGAIDVALAESTKDSDLAIDPRLLANEPLLEDAMTTAGFFHAASNQPGAWVNADGIPVDLMVPDRLGGEKSSRGGRIPPHDSRATRRAAGLEAAVVDRSEMEVSTADPDDPRAIIVHVAGPAALLVAKLHKIKERVTTPDRLNDKDAHDVYRLLRATTTHDLCKRFITLRSHDLSGRVTRDALHYLDELFAQGPTAQGSMMAGRAEEGVGEPEQVAMAASILAQDLLHELPRTDTGPAEPNP